MLFTEALTTPFSHVTELIVSRYVICSGKGISTLTFSKTWLPVFFISVYIVTLLPYVTVPLFSKSYVYSLASIDGPSSAFNVISGEAFVSATVPVSELLFRYTM